MKLNPNIALSPTGLVFNPATGESFTVNPIGLEILHYLRESRTSSEIIEAILDKYHVDRITLEKDLDDFIMILRNYALLEYEK